MDDRKRMKHLRHQLRSAHLENGGKGCFIVLDGDGDWISALAWSAIERAAERLGYPSVARAASEHAWEDILSEALEEAEGRSPHP